MKLPSSSEDNSSSEDEKDRMESSSHGSYSGNESKDSSMDSDSEGSKNKKSNRNTKVQMEAHLDNQPQKSEIEKIQSQRIIPYEENKEYIEMEKTKFQRYEREKERSINKKLKKRKNKKKGNKLLMMVDNELYSFPFTKEVMAIVFSMLNPTQLLKMRLVCKDWAAMAESDQLWKGLFNSEFKKKKKVKYIKKKESDESSSSSEIEEEEVEEISYNIAKQQQNETWLDFYFRNMRMKYPYKYSNYRPPKVVIIQPKDLRKEIVKLILYLIGTFMLLLTTTLLVLKAQNVIGGFYWEFGLAIAISIILIGAVCDYRFGWRSLASEAANSGGFTVMCLIGWLMASIICVLFGLAIDNIVTWSAAFLVTRVFLIYSSVMLFVDRFMKRLNALRAQGSLLFMVDNIVGLLCLFYFNLRVNSKLTDDQDTTEWMDMGLSIYAFAGIAFLFMLYMLFVRQKVRKANNRSLITSIEPFVFLFLASALFSATIVLFSFVVDRNQYNFAVVSIPVFIAQVLYLLYILYFETSLGVWTAIAERYRDFMY